MRSAVMVFPSKMRAFPSSYLANALTVDVEDYYHVSAFEDRVCRSNWDKLESRVEASTEKLLRIFGEAGVQGTFFILGWVADRYPHLIRRIVQEGHELASHGYWHQLVYDLTPEAFAADIVASKDAIANASGIEVSAYRAPSFSITLRSLWALEILVEHGFQIDSSIFPISGHDRYGIPGARKDIHDLPTTQGSICEFPPSVWTCGRFSIPIGGGYFRLFPLSLTQQAIRAVRRTGRPAIFYTHPWEIDPDQPTCLGINWKTRSRHYVGLKRTESRLRKMLALLPFDTMSKVLRGYQAAILRKNLHPESVQVTA